MDSDWALCCRRTSARNSLSHHGRGTGPSTLTYMATVRFFAQAREAAGTGTATIAGTTVGEVLDSAVAQYGSQFEAVLGMSKVWLNGEEVSREHPVTDKDEVAVLPPVSGGI